MHTFLMAANVPDQSAGAVLQSALEVAARVLPSYGVELSASYTRLPEIAGGWGWLAPAPERPPMLMSELVRPEVALLVYGTVQRTAGETAAEAVEAAWQRGGADAVRELDGCFAVARVDRRRRRLDLFTDIVGQRSLRLWARDGLLLVSPHDLLLAASGLPEPAMDLEAAASIVILQWSLGGRGLLRGVFPLRGFERAVWSDGCLRRLPLRPWDPADRVGAEDRRAVRVQQERILELMRADARRFLGTHARVESDVTAGIDTRVVLSLLLSVTAPERLEAVCHGEPESEEVVIAREVARRVGVRFRSVRPEEPAPETFLQHCDLRAFAMNGDTSSKRCQRPLPRYGAQATPRACGRAAAAVPGYYYLYFEEQRGWRGSFSAADARRLLADRYPGGRTRALPWADPRRSVQAFPARLDAALHEQYAPLAGSPYDLLDVFCLYERHGVWGAMEVRFPWLARCWSPFQSPQLVREAFRLPSPRGRYWTGHRMPVCRYVPRAAWIPVNGKDRPALAGPGRLRWRLRQADAFQRAARRSLRRRFGSGPAPAGRTMEALAEEMFAGTLHEAIRDLLTAPESLSTALFGRTGVSRMLEEHRVGIRSHLDVLSELVTMERWRLLVERAHRLARAAEPAGART